MLSVNNLIGFGAGGKGTPNIQFVGGNTATKLGAASGTSTIALNSGLTGGIASAVSEGDLVIAAFSTGSTADRTLSITDGTTAYTLLGTELYSNGSGHDCNLRVAYKFMGATPDTATTFGPTGDAADGGAMAVYVFRGVDSSSPLDVPVLTGTGTGTEDATGVPITPATAGAYIVCVAGTGHGNSTLTYTNANLTDLRSAGISDSEDAIIGIGHKPDWVSGEFDPGLFDAGDLSSSAATCSMSIALSPA
jgi:hypothetical protein